MDFYNELESRGLTNILRVVDYETPHYDGWEKVKKFLLDIVLNKKSVYVEGDYDVDGLMCSCIVKDSLEDLGVKDMYLYHYRSRSHNADRVAIKQCIQGHYDYFMILDAGSNDYSLLKSLTNYGIKVIILDHHVTEMSYEDYGEDFAVINTMIENRVNDRFRLSAGALCFTVMDLLYKELGRKFPYQLAAYATVSLFADVMDMRNELNRAIYYVGTRMPVDELPKPITYFLGEYNKFNGRYIGYWFSPRINACFRSEKFEQLNLLFFDDSDSVTKSDCITEIENIYVSNREMIGKVSDIVSVKEMSNFVVADLMSVDKYISVHNNKLWNYTGLVANQLSERFSKTAVTMCYVDNRYKGSVRDLYGRNYLSIFKQLCFAEGHNAAFGLKVGLLDYNSFIESLIMIDKSFSIQKIENEPLVINWDYQMPDEALLNDMARYNEFAGSTAPIVLLKKQIIGAIVERKTNYGFKYDWNGVEIQCEHKLNFGQYVLLKPFFSWKLKLQVQN